MFFVSFSIYILLFFNFFFMVSFFLIIGIEL